MEKTQVGNREAWREYFAKLIELRKNSNRVLKVHEKLLETVNGVELSEVFSSEPLRKITLGGLMKETFSENGLGVFYQKLYGVSIDIGKLAASLKAGIDLGEASKGLYGKVEKAEFVKVAEKTSAILDEICLLVKGLFELPSSQAEDISLEDSYIGQGVAEAFLRGALEVSLNSNPQSFFVSTLNRISRKYMRLAYPWLEGEAFEFVKNTFGLSEMIKPEFPKDKEKLSEEYTVWGFEKGSLGSLILELISATWDLFELPDTQRYFGIQSERVIYSQRAVSAWENAVPRERKAREIASALASTEVEEYRLTPNNPLKIWEEHVSKKGYRSLHLRHSPSSGYAVIRGDRYTLQGIVVSLPRVSYQWDQGPILMPFSDFIDYISPALFLSLAFLEGSEWGAPVLEER